MKVVAINGSPRKGGNTATLISRVFAELEAENIETEMINIGTRPIHGCIACMKCWENQNRKCVLNTDSINEILPKLFEADAIILGSPVYCADLSGQLKCLMDRTAMVAIANGDLFKRKLGAAVVAVRRAGGLPAFQTINSYFTIAQMIVLGSTYWNIGYGMEKQEVLEDDEGMQTMGNLGKNMAWLLKIIDHGKDIPQPETKREVMTNFIR